MLKKIVIGFGLLVLIAVAVVYGKYFYSKVAKDRAAIENVNKQHATADIEGDRIFQSRISGLRQLGIMGEKAAESKVDYCQIVAIQGGFVIVEWQQICKLYYVAGYTALLSREETFARLQTLFEGNPSMPSWAGDGCRFIMMSSFWQGGGLRRIPAGTTSESRNRDDCRIPDPIPRLEGTDTRQGSSQSISIDYTFYPGGIDQNIDLLWITYSHEYYRESLGCRPGLFPCGGPPRSRPIQAN